MTSLTSPHAAGLRRLSARAAAPPTPTTKNSLLPFYPSTHLKNSGTKIQPGLSNTEFNKIESEFGFTFPPDLRIILSSYLYVGTRFPNWRSSEARLHLRAMIELPIASVSFQVVKNSLWCKSWGLKPSDPEKALRVAKNVLKKAPLMIPIFDHCYIPCNPSLAGNPVFFIDETRIFCCGSDLFEYFERESAFRKSEFFPRILTQQRSVSEISAGSSSNFSRRSLDSGQVHGSGTSRWVDFWSEVAVACCRRNSTSSSSSSSSHSPKSPVWVNQYVNRIGSVLRGGGWSESDINEIIHVSASYFLESEVLGRISESLRKSGWSSEEVSDTFGFDFRPETEKKPVKKLTHALVQRIEKLAKWVSWS